MPSRSFTAAWYSARFSRWNGRQPGFGFSVEAASIFASSVSTNALIVAASGRRAPGGGIMPARSLRIIFSVTSACSVTLLASNPASTRSPDFIFSLWQVPQFCATSLFCSSIDREPTAALAAALAAGLAATWEAAIFGAAFWAETPAPRTAVTAAATAIFFMRFPTKSIGLAQRKRCILSSEFVNACRRVRSRFSRSGDMCLRMYANRENRDLTLLGRRAVQDPARPCLRHRPVFDRDLAVDDDPADPFRIRMRLFERRRVADRGGVEHGDVRLHPLPQHAPVRQADALRRERRHLADGVLERDRLQLAHVAPQHAHERPVAARVRAGDAEHRHLPVGSDHRRRMTEDLLQILLADRVEDAGAAALLDNPEHRLRGVVDRRLEAA